MRKIFLNISRQLGLMPRLDQARAFFQSLQNWQKNRAFKAAHPSMAMPPAEMLYETFRLDYQKYFEDGQKVAQQILNLYRLECQKRPSSILDWGCGPARVIRHVPSLVGKEVEVHGIDFNATTIAWCRENIPGVEFYTNQLHPPTSLSSNTYDLIYGISILTHLSTPVQKTWLNELYRLLAPDGILILTTQGSAFKGKLLASELSHFNNGRTVVRNAGQEGRRTFSAFHPKAAAESLFQRFEVCSYHAGQATSAHIEQDIWVLQKTH